MPPSRYLGLGWPEEWGDLDCLLHRLLRAHEAGLCDCGSGMTVTECEASTWVPAEPRRCGLRDAQEQWRRENPDRDPAMVQTFVPAGSATADPWREKGALPPVFD